MEYLFEFIIELALEGSIEISKNKKVPKVIRYPLLALIILLFLTVIGLIFLTGILIWKDNLIAGIFFIIIGLVMLVMSSIKFKKVYLKKVSN